MGQSEGDFGPEDYLECAFCDEKVYPDTPAAVVHYGEFQPLGDFDESDTEVYHRSCMADAFAPEPYSEARTEPAYALK